MTTPTDHMTIAEIIHDFATRYDLYLDRGAREDLAAILERRMVAERDEMDAHYRQARTSWMEAIVAGRVGWVALTEVLDRYFDFNVDPWDDHELACPAPEDVWRLHRDLKAALAAHTRTTETEGAS